MLRSVFRVSALRTVAKQSTARSVATRATAFYSVKSSPAKFQSLPQQQFQTLRFYSAPAAAAGSSLNKEDVCARVKEVIKTFNKNTNVHQLTPETAFNKDLGLDSLDTVELLVAVEEEFEIEIPDKIADELKTIGETVKYILSNPEAN